MLSVSMAAGDGLGLGMKATFSLTGRGGRLNRSHKVYRPVFFDWFFVIEDTALKVSLNWDVQGLLPSTSSIVSYNETHGQSYFAMSVSQDIRIFVRDKRDNKAMMMMMCPPRVGGSGSNGMAQ